VDFLLAHKVLSLGGKDAESQMAKESGLEKRAISKMKEKEAKTHT